MAGDIDIMNMLVKHGAELDARNIDDDTPLHVAASAGQTG